MKMKTIKNLSIIALLAGTIGLSAPAEAQLLQHKPSGTTTLSDLKKQQQQSHDSAPQQSESQASSSTKKAQPSKSAKKSQGKSAKRATKREKAEAMPEEFREEIIASMMARFRMCRNRSGQLINSPATGKPYAILYYPVQNMEYQACTGYKYSGNNPTNYTPDATGEGDEVVNALNTESNGNLEMRLATAAEIKTARSHGIVDMGAPADGIYLAVPQNVFNRLRDIVKQYDSGAVMD